MIMKEANLMTMPEAPVNPIDLVAQGATIIKMENAEQMAIAVQNPRDENRILAECLKEIDTYPSMAGEALYNKPVGRDTDTGKMKYAEGLSIRAAESIGNRWNNSSYGVQIVSEDEDAAIIAAVFLDYEKNTRHISMQRVSKYFKTKNGAIARIAPDRFDMVIKANGSKILREVILRSLPAGLKKEYELKARLVLKKEPIAKKRDAMKARGEEIGITEAQLAEWKQKAIKDFSNADILEAIGILNAIRDGEITVESIFKTKTQDEKGQEKPSLKVKPPEAATETATGGGQVNYADGDMFQK